MKRKINKNNFWITAVLAFFLFVQIPFLTGARYASWDESVYIGMAKHIYSSGQSGLWENFRPWVLPAFLGIFWKLGLDVVLFGKILALVFSCAVIYLVYLSGREMFDEKTGITASAITAITPVFFLNATNILAEIPSVMFALLSIYFILKRRPLLSGVFSASAFLTKFPQGIIAVVLAVLIFAYGKNKSNNKNSLLGAIRRLKPAVLRSSLNREFLELKTVGLKSEVLNSPVFNKRKTFKKNREMSNLLRFAAGFALVLSVGIALNFVFKNNFFVQLFKASLHQGNVFATESSSYFFYIAEIVKNNWLLLFSAAAFFAFVYSKTLKKNGKDGKNGKKSAKWLEHLEWLIVIFLVFLAYFSAIQNRQIRFSIIFLPYISLLSAFGTVFLWKKIRNLKMIASLFLLIIVALSALTLSRDVGYYNWVLKNEPDKATELYRMNYPKEGYLLTTDPIIASYSDAKIEPFYFSVDEGYEIFLEKRMNASAIVYNENFYPCFDEKCKQKKNEMLEFMEKNYSLAFKKKYDDVYYVFVRK